MSTCWPRAQPPFPEKEGPPSGLRGHGAAPPLRSWSRHREGRQAVKDEARQLIHESPCKTEHTGSKVCIHKSWLRCMIIKV